MYTTGSEVKHLKVALKALLVTFALLTPMSNQLPVRLDVSTFSTRLAANCEGN